MPNVSNFVKHAATFDNIEGQAFPFVTILSTRGKEEAREALRGDGGAFGKKRQPVSARMAPPGSAEEVQNFTDSFRAPT